MDSRRLLFGFESLETGAAKTRESWTSLAGHLLLPLKRRTCRGGRGREQNTFCLRIAASVFRRPLQAGRDRMLDVALTRTVHKRLPFRAFKERGSGASIRTGLPSRSHFRSS